MLQPVAAPPTSGNLDPRSFPFFGEDFAFVDTETTGVDAEVDRIVEIAIIRYRAGVREVFHTLIDPQVPIPPTASAVHHITDETIREAKARGEAPTLAQASDTILEKLDGAYVYAHNAPFDEAFVDGELDIPLDAKQWICSVRLARHLMPDAPAYGNQVLRYWFRTEPESAGLGPHRAVDDVFVSLGNTYHLWAAAAARGLTTQGELLELSNTPIKIESMAFGKYAGKALRDIPSHYFAWCLGPEGMSDMDDDLRHSMVAELERPGRKEDDERIQSEQAASIVPATNMLFGKVHHGKLMADVPQDYLEWIQRERPRCTPDVLAGVMLELSRREQSAPTSRRSSSAPEGQSAIAVKAYGRLVALVRPGTREAAMLDAARTARDPHEALCKYLAEFARHEPDEYKRVAQLVGGEPGQWMLQLVQGTPTPERRAVTAPTQDNGPSGNGDAAPMAPGRRQLFAKRQAEPGADEAGPPPVLEESAAPFAPASAPRRPRMP